MLTPTTPEETAQLTEMAERTKVFYSHEIITLQGVFDDYFAEARDVYNHACFTARHQGEPVGFVYLAPVEMTDRTWELWWIVVDPTVQGRGLGGQILEASERAVADAGGRVLLIETSALPIYTPTQKFYLKHGYRLVATIPDYYRDGDDKQIYWKRLDPHANIV